MADRGIIFSAPMVQALLDGRKTQTRRLLNPQPPTVEAVRKLSGSDYHWFVRHASDRDWSVAGPVWAVRQITGENFPKIKVPNAVGDRLYVRENFQLLSFGDYLPTKSEPSEVRFAATDPLAAADKEVRGYPWRPCIHMPRWASRLTLIVTDVRVQRVQDIGEVDAIREGVTLVEESCECPRDAFAALWDSLHPKDGTRWQDNPWIYALTFNVQHGNIDRIAG